MKTRHFGPLRADIDDQARLITLAQKTPSGGGGGVSTGKLIQWALDSLAKYTKAGYDIRTEASLRGERLR